MKKKDELADPNSCFNKAKDDEIIFVLLERDDASPGTILAWARERIRLGLNKITDAKIIEALKTARQMKLRRLGQVDNFPDYLSDKND